jgi:hypothetical protein
VGGTSAAEFTPQTINTAEEACAVDDIVIGGSQGVFALRESTKLIFESRPLFSA